MVKMSYCVIYGLFSLKRENVIRGVKYFQHSDIIRENSSSIFIQ